MRFDLPANEVQYIEEMAAKQAMETIRNRIDQFGVAEPDIRRQGKERIHGLQVAGPYRYALHTFQAIQCD